MADSAVVGPTTGSYNFNQQFNQAQNQTISSGGSYSGPDIYSATLENTDYNNALNFHSGNYQNILSGYQKALGLSQSNADRISQGYQGLNKDVQGTIAGIDASQRQAITDTYNQQQGATTSSAVGRGLGNSTVLDSLQRGNTYDYNKANIALSNQMAQLQAGYQGQFGSAALAAQGTAAQQQASLGGQYMGVLGGQQDPRFLYAPNTVRSQNNSTSTGNSIGYGLGGGSSQTIPGVASIGQPGQGGVAGISVSPPPQNPFTGLSSGAGVSGINAYTGFPTGSFYNPAGSQTGGAAHF